jgi:ABC-type phosphate transport system auxiliary subunit
LAAWKNKSYSVNDEVAAIRLQKAKKKQAEEMNTADQQAIAAKRDEDNARLEQEIEARKAGAVSYEEYLKMKEKNESNDKRGTGV